MERVIDLLEDSKDKTILRYYYGMGYSAERIAEEMGISVSTAYRRIQECLALLGDLDAPRVIRC